MGVATQIPQDTFDEIQTDAGILLSSFDITNPANVADENIITATTGGFTVSVSPTFSDMGSDVDNCPENTKELKHLDSWAITVQFTAISTNADMIKMALGACDADTSTGKISPRAPKTGLSQSDFIDSLYWIGDKADGGLVVVKLLNVLSTAGLSLKTTKNGKGQISCTLTAHVSIKALETMPVEFYVLDGADELSIMLSDSSISLVEDDEYTIGATVTPNSATKAWSSSDDTVATVTSGGVVTAEGAGVAVIMCKATADGASKIATCMVNVAANPVTETQGEG